jgi:dihydrofolate synthase/folylpolyglutamate synthase
MLDGSVADLEAWFAQSFSRELSGSYDGLKLGPLRQVLARLPVPPAPITIAGTKGKGSTLRLLESILLAHGARTLAFTSPHVRSITERWRIDGVPVDAGMACAAARRVAAAEQDCAATLTYFERGFAIAVVLSAADPKRHFLCEVGLGGRLDCANALDARIAVLTHLSRDHCQVLGDTLEAIAGEKLAIARPGRPLVIAPQSPAARSAIASRLPPCEPQWISPDPEQAVWPLALIGAHQRENLATAVHLARLLLAARFSAAIARSAVAEVRLAARCQLVEAEPWKEVLVDGAHNGPSVAATLAAARERWPAGFTLILGCATDKELAEILAAIPSDQAVLRCGYQGPRARGPEAWGPAATWPWHADIQAALEAAPQGRPICITGSFYLAAEALTALGAVDSIPG